MPGNLTPAARSEFARGLFIGVNPSDELLWFSSDARQVYVGFLALALLDEDDVVVSLGTPVRPVWEMSYLAHGFTYATRTVGQVVLQAPADGANALVLASAPVANPAPEQLLLVAVKRLPVDEPLPGAVDVSFPAGKIWFGSKANSGINASGYSELFLPMTSSGAARHFSQNQYVYKQQGMQDVEYVAQFPYGLETLELARYVVGRDAFTANDGLVENFVFFRITNTTWWYAQRARVFFGPKFTWFVTKPAPWENLFPGQSAVFRPGRLRAVVT